MSAMKDDQFLADAAKAQIDIEPMTGETVEALITRFSASSPSVIERAKKAVSQD